MAYSTFLFERLQEFVDHKASQSASFTLRSKGHPLLCLFYTDTGPPHFGSRKTWASRTSTTAKTNRWWHNGTVNAPDADFSGSFSSTLY